VLAVQPHAQRRQQLFGVDRLGEIIRSPGFQAFLAVALHSLGSQGDDGQAAEGGIFPDAPDGLIAVHFRHHDVHQHDRDFGRLIDDIDRLTAEEIRQLFRVVKAVADFPNVIYLLAFDIEVVVKALNSMQNTPGEQYLEKLVQLPLDLPAPDKTGLQDMLTKRLDMALTGTNELLFDRSRWVNLYVEGIADFFVTPRDVIRFCNAMAFNYPAVSNEVNAVDFIVIELLRVFSPKAYYFIRDNESIFAGPGLNPVYRTTGQGNLSTDNEQAASNSTGGR